MNVATGRRLTEFRYGLVDAANSLDVPVSWRAATGPAKYEEMNLNEQTFILVGTMPPGEANELLLDELLDSHGENSVRIALEADRTLAGAYDVVVTSTSGAREWKTEDGLLIGAEWRIKALFD